MDEAPHLPGPVSRPAGQIQTRPLQTRPLSPHLQIYGWTVTMAASITHRLTGVALAAGIVLVAWWLFAAASGADTYLVFVRVASHPVGLVVLFGLLWSLAFHLLNGIRHLAWDLGYGFKLSTARLTGALVYLFSVLIAAGAFVLGLMVRGGFGV